MFSLIVTIIAIALVAALALATIYYGGTAFTFGGARAAAAKVVNEGQQIQGALELYKSDNNGSLPTTIDDLVTGTYLSSLPENATAGNWQFTTDYVVISGLSENQCIEANKIVNISGVPSCTDPAIQGITACCQD